MPRIRLVVERDANSAVVIARSTDADTVAGSNLRVVCGLFAGRDRHRHTAVVDTGAPTTVFPFVVWQRFQAEIRWLTFADGVPRKSATLGGARYQYRLGRVSVRLVGKDDEPVLPAVDVIAQFEQLDPMKTPAERLTRTLVGLQLGPLEGRYLVVGPRQTLAGRCEAWVTDERPADPPVLTSATL